ncbi:hypothetical protein JW906_12240 [bacterium]|nr:hypothetical protein [bacterium]
MTMRPFFVSGLITFLKSPRILLLAGLCVSAFYAGDCRTRDQLPHSVDLSNTPFFPPVMDQGEIGSCDWFAVVYYQMTFLYNRQYQRPVAPENTFSPQFGYNILNNAGSFPYNIRVDDVYKFVERHGCAVLTESPYDRNYLPWCTDAAVWRNALQYRTAGYSFFTFRDESPGADDSFGSEEAFLHEMKSLLSAGEVLVIQSETFAGFFSRIADDPATGEDDPFIGESILIKGKNGPEHTVAVVGYNDHVWADLNRDGVAQAAEKGALKIADSIGPDAPDHNRGFLWMAYSAAGPSIFQHRVNRMIIRDRYVPRILAKLTLNAQERDKIRFQFGRSPKAEPPLPAGLKSVFDPYGLGYEPCTAGVSLIAGGDLSFGGGKEPGDGSFTFDLTDLDADGSGDYWYFRITNSGEKPVIIREFEILDTEEGFIIADQGLPFTLVQQEVYRSLKLRE